MKTKHLTINSTLHGALKKAARRRGYNLGGLVTVLLTEGLANIDSTKEGPK